MAKALKKRALAEYSQTTTLDDPEVTFAASAPPPKKLKIIKRQESGHEAIPVSLEDDINSLDPSKPPHENFRTLSKIVLYFPSNNAATETLLLSKLKALYLKEKNSALKAKVLTTIQLLKITQAEPLGTMNDIMEMVKNETSSLVIVSGLNVAIRLATAINDPAINSRLLELANTYIKFTDAKVKCKCLELIAALSTLEDPVLLKETLTFVHSYSHSHEPRIRSSAFKTLLHLHEKGASLDVEMYDDVTKYLDDDYESVRLAAIQLLWAISQKYWEHPVSTPTCPGENVRLIDDAFAKICHAINDPIVQVRVLAATLLGKMPQVGQAFLDQTLDKKLMSDMRRKKSAHERQWEKVKAGEWSSGKVWADDKPQEVIDADSVMLISSGAAGAFVHGLEDEFMEVRSAAVDSLCILAVNNPDFANLALDFLVDMFNDEIEEVRLKAIDSLTKISRHIVLWEDQLETILGALEDSSIDIREGLHTLLSVCHVMTKDCVKMVFDNILTNLKKYPQDKKSIWKCLEGVGKNHPWVILPLVPTLLATHPYLDTPERQPEEADYVCVLILVFNAAKGCNTMSTLFDENLLKHYHYLRDTLPHLVPELSIGNESASVVSSTKDKSGATSGSQSHVNGRLVLKELTGKLKNSENLSPEMKQRLSKLILKDLKRLAEVDQEISAVAKFTALYIRAQLVFGNCLDSTSWIQLTQNSQNDSLKLQIQSFLQLCLKMHYCFSGLNSQENAIIMQLKLRALAFQLVYIVRGSNQSALASCQYLLEQAEKVQKYLEENGGLKSDSFTVAMFEVFDSLEDPKPGTVAKLLLPLFEQHPIQLVSFISSIQMASATIVEPTGESETPLKFTAGLLLGINLDAEISNIEDPSLIRIQIKYPDQQVHLICPRRSDFRIISPNVTRLLTIVRVSHQAWTEPCAISLSVVLDLTGPETNYNRKLVGKGDPTYTIALSKEKQVLVAPKPPKRGL